jgi:hypothetical protein
MPLLRQAFQRRFHTLQGRMRAFPDRAQFVYTIVGSDNVNRLAMRLGFREMEVTYLLPSIDKGDDILVLMC